MEHAVESKPILYLVSLCLILTIITDRIKSFKDPTEPLTPGVLYVGVAALGGSIIARNRFIGTRLLLPPAFFFLSLNYFLPKTSHNVLSYFGLLEETYFPDIAHKHAVANAHTRMGWEMFKESSQAGRKKFTDGAQNLVEKIQEVSGLKLKEAFKTVESKVKEVEKKVEGYSTK